MSNTPEFFYDMPLARVHDRYYGGIALAASRTILHLLGDNTPSGQQIVDLGCGSGILARELSEKGYPVLGVDISPAMLVIADGQAPRASFRQASLFDFSIPVCKVVSAVGEPICYLPDAKNSMPPVSKLFRQVYEQLEPGGFFVFDVLTTEADPGGQSRMVEQESMTMFIDISVDLGSQILTREMTFFVKEGDLFSKHREIHRQQLFDRDDLERLLLEISFHVTQADHYDDHPFRKGHTAFICRK